jgi:hypothetical protein
MRENEKQNVECVAIPAFPLLRNIIYFNCKKDPHFYTCSK